MSSAPAPQPPAAYSRTRPYISGARSPSTSSVYASMTPLDTKHLSSMLSAKMLQKPLASRGTASSMSTRVLTTRTPRYTAFFEQHRSAATPHAMMLTLATSGMTHSSTPICVALSPFST